MKLLVLLVGILLSLLGSLGYVIENILIEIENQPKEEVEQPAEIAFNQNNLASTIRWASQELNVCSRNKDNPFLYQSNIDRLNNTLRQLKKETPQVRWSVPFRYITKTHVVLEYEYTMRKGSPGPYRLSVYRWPALCIFGNRSMGRKSFDRLVLPVEEIDTNLLIQLHPGDRLDIVGTLVGLRIEDWTPTDKTPYLAVYVAEVGIDPCVSSPIHSGRPRGDKRGDQGETSLKEELVRRGLGQ